MYKALLIGCGNIGALYDIDSDQVLTHAKAYSNIEKINVVDVFDRNQKLANRIAGKYGFFVKEAYDTINLREYEIISICSPTTTHSLFLEDCMKAEVPVILCEKPIAYKVDELIKLKSIYNQSKSKVLVNYIRRFQIGYEKLKEYIKSINEEVKYINVRYYKGILNYASHALDTAEYLLDKPFDISHTQIIDKRFDYFKEDPTIYFTAKSKDVILSFNGYSVNYPIFEMDLIFENYQIRCFDGGNKIYIYEGQKLKKQLTNLLDNYMIPVMKKGVACIANDSEGDNFLTSLELNQKLLKVSQSNSKLYQV